MRRLISMAALVIAGAMLTAAPVGAVTNGSPDGSEHSSVGALLIQVPGFDDPWIGCTGTLIGATVFLTAGHCTFYMSYVLPAGTTYTVSFDEDLNVVGDELIFGGGIWTPVDPDNEIAVTGWETMPAYASPSSDHRDIGVVHLGSAPTGLTPVDLPPLDAAAATVGGSIVNVGYGWNSLDRSPTSPNAQYSSDGLRRSGASWVNAVSPNWLSAHSGPSSPCYHDSGGPQFAGTTLVSITALGDTPCANLSRNQRLDLLDVQTWLLDRLDD